MKNKVTAKKFKHSVATVPRAAKCFVGFTTVVMSACQTREVALFAPTKSQLLRSCNEAFPAVPIDPSRFQRVAYFLADRIKRRRGNSAGASRDGS